MQSFIHFIVIFDSINRFLHIYICINQLTFTINKNGVIWVAEYVWRYNFSIFTYHLVIIELFGGWLCILLWFPFFDCLFVDCFTFTFTLCRLTLINATFSQRFFNIAFFGFNLFNLNYVLLIIVKNRWYKWYSLKFIGYFLSIRCNDSGINPDPVQYFLFCLALMLHFGFIKHWALMPHIFQVNIHVSFVFTTEHTTLQQLYV